MSHYMNGVRLISINKNEFDMVVNWSYSQKKILKKILQRVINYLIKNFDLRFRRGFGCDCFLLDIILLKLKIFLLGFIQLIKYIN